MTKTIKKVPSNLKSLLVNIVKQTLIQTQKGKERHGTSDTARLYTILSQAKSVHVTIAKEDLTIQTPIGKNPEPQNPFARNRKKSVRKDRKRHHHTYGLMEDIEWNRST